VVKATEQEQDHWSDRANSPSPTIKSPVQDSISQIMSPEMATVGLDDIQMYNYRRELSPEPLIANTEYQDAVISAHNRSEKPIEELTATQNIEQSIDKGKQKEQLPQIEIDSGSDNSMNHYFPESQVTQEEVKSRMSSIWDTIGSKKESPVSGSPRIAQVGLQPSINPAPETTSEQPTSWLDAIKSRRDNPLAGLKSRATPEHSVPESSKPKTLLDQIKTFKKDADTIEDQPESSYKEKPSALLDQIRSGKSLKSVGKSTPEAGPSSSNDQSHPKLKSVLDKIKQNDSDKDISEGKSTITKPFKYLLTQSEYDERKIAANKGKMKELENEAGPSKPRNLNEALSSGFDKMSKADIEQVEDNETIWDDSEPQVSEIEKKSQKLLSPLPASTSNLFEDTMNLFEDDDVSIVDELPSNTKDPLLQRASEDHQIRRKNSQLSIKDSLIIDWNSVNIEMVDRNDDRCFRIYFGDAWRSTEQIVVRTNDNYIATIDFDPSMIPDWNNDLPKIITFDWGHKFNKLDSLGYKTEVHDIQIKDISGKLHEIYRNDSVLHN